MNKVNQKNAFLESEGDEWYTRNIKNYDKYRPEDDFLLSEIVQLRECFCSNTPKLLEIGCSAGKRLLELKNKGFDVYGIDPSQKAIQKAKECKINAVVGTADELPYDQNSFDILVYGFCLYLCDREDLFKITAEANRVLKQNGYVLILDFHSDLLTQNNYHHLDGIISYKMDYGKLFYWHPSYSLIKLHTGLHVGFNKTDNKDEWIAISLIKKT